MKAGHEQGVGDYVKQLKESKYESFKRYDLWYSESRWLAPSIAVTIYLKMRRAKNSDMECRLSRTNTVSRIPFTQAKTCRKVKKSGSCT